jgi:CRP-like cAMP-binding protein/HEAT repeat protein
VMISLSFIMATVVDYQMKWIASTMNEQDLARFFGNFYAIIGFAQLLFQFLLVPRLLKTLGIINCLMILPALLAIVNLSVLAGMPVNYFGLSLLAFAATANFLRIVLTETLDLPSREMLFLPLPTRIRLRAQPFMNGALAAIARGFSAEILFLLYTLGVAVEMISLVAILCCTALVISLTKLRPKYRATLAATLRAQEIEASDLHEVARSDSMAPVMQELLESNDSNVVKFTLELAQTRKIGEMTDIIKRLVDSRESPIVVEALKCLGADGSRDHLPIIRRKLMDSRPSVKEAAVQALCQVSGFDVIDAMTDMLKWDDQALKDATIIGLARHCGDEGKKRVFSIIEDYVETRDSLVRYNAARLLGGIAQPGFSDLTRRLLADPEPEVCLKAIEAAGKSGDIDLITDLLGAMKEPELKTAAVSALASMPKKGVELLPHHLLNGVWTMGDRRILIQVMSRIGGPEAVRVLFDQVRDTDQALMFRATAAHALRSLRGREGLYNLKLKEYNSLLDKEYETLKLLNQAREEVGGADKFAAEAYKDHARLSIEIILSMFALKYDPRQIDRVHFNLFSESAPMRSRAMELLDVLLPRKTALQIASLLHPVVENKTPEGKELFGATRDSLIRCEPWIRAITAYHLSGGDPDPDSVSEISLNTLERQLYSRLEMISFLKQVPLFSDFAAAFLLEQTDLDDWIPMDKGRVLFEQGDKGDCIYIIREGEAGAWVNGSKVAGFGPGECVGEMALLDERPRFASVVIEADAILLRVEQARFKQLLTSKPGIAGALMRTLDKRIRKTQAGRVSIAPPSASNRMSHALVMDNSDLHRIVPIVSFLGQVDLFKGLPMTSLTRLAGIVQEVSYSSGEELFKQGEIGDSLYLVCSGSIDVIADGIKVANLAKNAYIGEMALVGGLKRSATAAVVEDAVLLRMWAEDFDHLIETEQEVSLALLKTLSNRLRDVTGVSG